MTIIKISIESKVFYAELLETPTASAIIQTLPIQSYANTWGDEIYFEVAAQATLEPGAQAQVEVGDLAYWPSMPAFCIFFGPTPASTNQAPVAASPVNVFGRLVNADWEQLRKVKHEESITVEVADTESSGVEEIK